MSCTPTLPPLLAADRVDDRLTLAVLAEAGIAAQTRARLGGRLLAGTAATLDMNTITRPGCEELPDTPVDEP